ncbi:MAG: PD40 domain-containing protein [Candidatus Bipolaricaulota bacterium]|nr:MAG: PD40 domain-containing protein [Candidatus Bipolaricaulota bacterium]
MTIERQGKTGRLPRCGDVGTSRLMRFVLLPARRRRLRAPRIGSTAVAHRRASFAEPAAGEILRRKPKTGGIVRTRAWGVAVTVTAVLIAVGGCTFLQPEQPTYRYWEPARSPDGTQVVYSSPVGEAFELFLWDPATGGETQLTRNGAINWAPSWAPDSSRIVFASQRNDNIDLYVIDAVSGEETRLTTHEKEDVNPSWGPDGRILFNSSRSESWELYAIDPDGLNLERISPAVGTP